MLFTTTLTLAGLVATCLSRSLDLQSPLGADPTKQCFGQDPVCPSAGDVGIRYGHCYTMTSVDGEEPFCRTSDNALMAGGYTCNLIFRICKTADDCDESQGTYVPWDGTWAMQDQIGRVEGVTAGSKMPAHLVALDSWIRIRDFTTQYTKYALSFTTAYSQCMFGACSHCLRLADGSRSDNRLGIRNVEEHKDWGTHKMFPGPSPNLLSCLAVRFREVACRADVIAKPAKA